MFYICNVSQWNRILLISTNGRTILPLFKDFHCVQTIEEINNFVFVSHLYPILMTKILCLLLDDYLILNCSNKYRNNVVKKKCINFRYVDDQ